MTRPTLVRNARVVAFAPGIQGDAVLLRDGRVESVGAGRELAVDVPDAREVDLGGALLLPGFTDTHTHFFEWSRRLSGIDLSAATTLDEVDATLRETAATLGPQPHWVGGSGWDPHGYGHLDLLDRQRLDAVFPDRPVVLEARDFHTLWCNSRALEAAGLLGADVGRVEVPAGGRVGRAADGAASGLLFETAWDLIWKVRPSESEAVAERWIDRALRRAHGFGLTGVHCMEPMSTLAHYRRLVAREELPLRICFHTPLDDLAARIERGERGYTSTDPWLRLGGVKVFMDGSLGSRSACMHHPYPDGSHGVLLREPAELDEILGRAAASGIPGTVHAIGDRTVEIVADAFTRIRTAGGGGLLHRIEHAQCVPPAAARRLASARVYCAMQPVHLADDASLLDAEWGEASRWAYPFRSLLDLGVGVGFGSDAPVATPDPRPGIVAALERRGGPRAEGPQHQPDERLELMRVLRAYTRDAAVGSAREDELGSIRPGALADLTAFDDVMDEAPEAWLDAQVRLTVVDGDIVYENL